MKIAFLFSGQGAQYVGMGETLIDNPVGAAIFARANEALGFDITDIMFNGPEEKLMQTRYTQPAILTLSIALYEILKANGLDYDVLAGLSLGEYGALYAANSFDLETVLPLVHERGKLMETAAAGIDTAMYAIIGAERATILNICEQVSGVVEASNFNCPGQIVISGEKQAVEAAINLCKDQGIRSIPLKVGGAFHTSLLKPASEELQKILDKVTIQKPTCPVLTNVTGGYITADSDSIRKTLAKQVYSSVYFEDELHQMIADGVDTFVEIGPKNTLVSFVKKTSKDVIAYKTDTLAGIEAVISELKPNLESE